MMPATGSEAPIKNAERARSHHGGAGLFSVALYARWREIELGVVDTALLAVTVGPSILVWREAGNPRR
jgi:hypothetical protein